MRIYDKKTHQNLLVPLSSLIKIMWQTNPSVFTGDWFVFFASAGHGEKAVQLDNAVSGRCPYKLSGEVLFPWLMEEYDYFDHFGIMKNDNKTIIGVFDSHFLFIEIEDQIIIDQIQQYYESICIITDEKESIKRFFV